MFNRSEHKLTLSNGLYEWVNNFDYLPDSTISWSPETPDQANHAIYLTASRVARLKSKCFEEARSAIKPEF